MLTVYLNDEHYGYVNTHEEVLAIRRQFPKSLVSAWWVPEWAVGY